MIGSLEAEAMRALPGLGARCWPVALLLHGTRDLSGACDWFCTRLKGQRLDTHKQSFFRDHFYTEVHGRPLVFAAVYGAAMATELVHVFGKLGTRQVVHTGTCGAIDDALTVGDLVSITAAYGGDGASTYYSSRGAAFHGAQGDRRSLGNPPEHSIPCRAFTTAALFQERWELLQTWRAMGCSVVDMETAGVFASSAYFAMRSASLAVVSDHLLRHDNVGLSDVRFQGDLEARRERLLSAALGTLAEVDNNTTFGAGHEYS